MTERQILALLTGPGGTELEEIGCTRGYNLACAPRDHKQCRGPSWTSPVKLQAPRSRGARRRVTGATRASCGSDSHGRNPWLRTPHTGIGKAGATDINFRQAGSAPDRRTREDDLERRRALPNAPFAPRHPSTTRDDRRRLHPWLVEEAGAARRCLFPLLHSARGAEIGRSTSPRVPKAVAARESNGGCEMASGITTTPRRRILRFAGARPPTTRRRGKLRLPSSTARGERINNPCAVGANRHIAPNAGCRGQAPRVRFASSRATSPHPTRAAKDLRCLRTYSDGAGSATTRDRTGPSCWFTAKIGGPARARAARVQRSSSPHRRRPPAQFARNFWFRGICDSEATKPTVTTSAPEAEMGPSGLHRAFS